MKVLIVDDQFENLYLLETILKANGFVTFLAANGVEALAAARKNIPDIIISDILMPVMDGFTLCRELKKDKSFCNIPIIFYTATYTDPKDEEFALSLGANRYVLKPQDPDDLMGIIEDVLKKAKNNNIQMKEDLPKPEDVVLKQYNEVLVRKLEDKMLQLELSERELRENNILLHKEIEQHTHAELEIKHTLEALRESEERFRSVTQSANDAIITADRSGKILEWNQGAEIIFGYSKNEVIEKKLDIIIPRKYFEQYISTLESYKEGKSDISVGRVVELVGRHKSGMEFPLELSLAGWETASGTFFTGIIRDITKRKKSEKEVRMLAHSIESIAECVSITDADDKIIFVNDAFVKTYGYRREELLGKHISIVRPIVWGEIEKFKDILPRTIEGSWKGEVINRKKDGTEFPIYLSTSVIKDDNAKPIALIGVATDITELYKSRDELIKAKEKAEEADKLKSEFLAQMSHEIRTPINIILGNVDFLSDSIGGNIDSDAQESFKNIDSASRRIIRTIDLILNAAELITGTYKPNFVQLNLHSKVLSGLFAEYKSFANDKGLEFIYNKPAEEIFVLADEYSVNQIFANLIDNAIKYTPKGKIELFMGKNKDGNIIVEVKDTGIGMSKDFLKNIFKPFTQEDQGYSRAFDGNGLGLANVKKYCVLNYAYIEIESEKNIGTTARVIFNRL